MKREIATKPSELLQLMAVLPSMFSLQWASLHLPSFSYSFIQSWSYDKCRCVQTPTFLLVVLFLVFFRLLAEIAKSSVPVCKRYVGRYSKICTRTLDLDEWTIRHCAHSEGTGSLSCREIGR